jgi:hypothetical protein
MLETTREFGLEQLAWSGELELLRRRHAGYFLALAEQAEPELWGPAAGAWLERLNAERDNFRAALDWCLASGSAANVTTALRLAGALARFWWMRGPFGEGRQWLARALEAVPERSAARMKALHGAGWLAHFQRDLAAARAALEESLSIANELDPRLATRRGLTLLGGSLAGLLLGRVAGWPVWATTLVVALPWLPLFVAEATRTFQRQAWLGFFFVLTALQLAHLGEHVAQMVQIHLLGLQGEDASGIFGVFNVEWVHFVWNGLVVFGVVLLLTRYPHNRWLWLTAPIAGWHLVEHTYILSVYLDTGVSGTPGLLSHGGLLSGGLPLVRPDLHFGYNLIETVPLVAAFLVEVRRSAR